MIYQKILDSVDYQQLTHEEKGMFMDIYMKNLVSGGLPAEIKDDELSEGLAKSLERAGLISSQICLEKMRIGYVNSYAVQYLSELGKASVIVGDQGLKSAGLIERSKIKQCSVGYKELGTRFEGYLPTTRYDSTNQVFFVSDRLVEEIDKITLGLSTSSLLEDYFNFLVTNPKLRPTANRMGASLIKFAKNRYGSIGKNREKMLLEALSGK